VVPCGRNMIRRGVPQKTPREICEISGHKTGAVFSRYNILSEATSGMRPARSGKREGRNSQFIHRCTRTGQ
jgi:hypothetical protein